MTPHPKIPSAAPATWLMLNFAKVGGGQPAPLPPSPASAVSGPRQGWRNDQRWGGVGEQAFQGPKVTPSENGKVTGFNSLFFETGPTKQKVFIRKKTEKYFLGPCGPNSQGAKSNPLPNRTSLVLTNYFSKLVHFFKSSSPGSLPKIDICLVRGDRSPRFLQSRSP